MNDYYKEVVTKVEDPDEEVLGPFHPNIVPKEEQTDETIDLETSPKFGPSNAYFDKMNKEHDEYVAALRSITKRETDHERKKELRRVARKWMGAIIFKDIDDVEHMGKVADYEVETGWFKIMYNNYEEEEMKKDEVIQLLADPERLRPFFDLLPASSEKHRPKRKKSMLPTEKKVNSAHASNTPAPTYQRPKRPRRAKEPSTYVPLAVRETKKDAYYWYR